MILKIDRSTWKQMSCIMLMSVCTMYIFTFCRLISSGSHAAERKEKADIGAQVDHQGRSQSQGQAYCAIAVGGGYRHPQQRGNVVCLGGVHK